MFSVQALLYGDHYKLAERLVGSFRAHFDWSLVSDVRFGLNEVCDKTRELVFDFCETAESPWYIYEPECNALKYPLMRRMFHDKDRPITAPYVMWFDDDSCLVADDAMGRFAKVMENTDMAGQVWKIPITAKQQQFIKTQVWYTNKPQRKKFTFIQGGFWTIRNKILQKWQWPPSRIHHNGGDTLLGELFYRQNYRMKDFRYGTWVNADEAGKNSASARRGAHTTPVGANYNPIASVNFSHLDFKCKVYYAEL